MPESTSGLGPCADYKHDHPGSLKANLILSFQAAYTGPVVMMSQNRQTEKDRLMAQHDYEINRKAEEELEVVMDHLEHQDRLILDATARLEARRLPGAGRRHIRVSN